MGTEGIQDKYVNPYTDFGFKLLFGTVMNKDLLISFLNALLFGEETVKDVTYLNTEHLGTQEYDRRAIFDVYCENEKGEKFLVEMQRGEQQFFKDRSLYYSTFPIREQGKRGPWDYELKAVYVVGILNFSFDETDNEHFHHEVKLVDLHTHKVFYDKLTFVYLEMPKFSKPEEELETMFDKWLFVLRNLSSLLERPRALQERVFNHLFEAAEIAKFSRKELSEYWESLKNFRDWYSVMKTQLKKGREEGRKEGLEEGLEKGRKEGLEKGRREMQWMNACKMKEDGMSIEMTARYSGLSEDELRELFL
ncbi:Rpn family recombination-promoting nuclease/putative transposase [uncultured Phocaeicola sp.]|uniref:Rpn family recombination-promoting nuclease/putative transposase n=1 Tax=uncultured Phocaeicola sp. TaxID=990718 RepID=UPI00261E1C89|nr:Rpn family recombination-promoting nuclease/putative transposase [uncultured Phocaeicola sp.]